MGAVEEIYDSESWKEDRCTFSFIKMHDNLFQLFKLSVHFRQAEMQKTKQKKNKNKANKQKKPPFDKKTAEAKA